MNTEEWWKYPDSFLKLVMNTGKTKEVTREDVNSEILESLINMGDRLWNAAVEDEAALPFPGDYRINLSWDAGSASFTINQGVFPLSYGYFSSEYDEWESAWGCVESHYLGLTDKSGTERNMPEKPESKPCLAVIRLTGDLRCECELCEERRQNNLTPAHPPLPMPNLVEAVESAMGLLLAKEGFPKELYEENPGGETFY